MTKTIRKRILLAVAAVVVVTAAAWAAVWGIGEYQRTHHKTAAQLLWQLSENNYLAATESDELFTFTLPQNFAQSGQEDALRPGAQLELTGPEYFLTIYPMQYPDVLEVVVTGQRPDYITEPYQRLSGAQLSAEQLYTEIEQLPDLNQAERNALHWLLQSSAP